MNEYSQKYKELIQDLKILDSPISNRAVKAIEELIDVLELISNERIKTEEEFDEGYNRAFRSGKSAGMREAANAIMVDAISAFEHGNDSLANELRKKARGWKAKSEEEHPGIPK